MNIQTYIERGTNQKMININWVENLRRFGYASLIFEVSPKRDVNFAFSG